MAKAQKDPARSVPSSHRVSPIRTQTINTLGVQRVGFWADWAQRYKSAKGPEGSPAGTFTNKMLDPVKPLPTTKVALHPDEYKPDAVKPYRATPSSQSAQPQGGRANLPQFEKEVTWGQLVSRTRKTPFLSTSNEDFQTMERNFMDHDLVYQMNADPTLFLSQALKNYYLDKQKMQQKAWASNATNFEQMTGMFSAMKKKNSRVVGRFIAPTENQKQAIKEQQNYQKSGKGPKPMNVKMGGYYSSPLYLSPFG